MCLCCFVILTLLLIDGCRYGNAFNVRLQDGNQTDLVRFGERNNKTLFPVDAADLLECSKEGGYILLDKTAQVAESPTSTAKLVPLETLYLSSDFFGIMESIVGTSGDFVGDSISGSQLSRVLDVLKETRVQLYFGSFQDSPDLSVSKPSSINLSCVYGNFPPSLISYHFNNFCELTQGASGSSLLLSEDNICNFQHSEKYIYGDKMKYFNVLASLNIPILNYQEFDQQFLSMFNTLNLYNDQQLSLSSRYLLFSNELGLSFFISFGIGLFGKLESEKYYLLMKIVPPSTFWVKDYEHYSEKAVEDKPMTNRKSCAKYENGIRFSNQSTISLVETDKDIGHLAVRRNSILYLNLSLKNAVKCLAKHSASIIYSGPKGAESMVIFKIFDHEKNGFQNMEEVTKTDNKMELNYVGKLGSNYGLLSTNAKFIIINENSSDIYIDYKVSCQDFLILPNLFSNVWYLVKKGVQYSDHLEVALYSTKGSSYSNRPVVIMVLVILLLISAPILGLFAIIVKSIIKRYDSGSRISHLKIPLKENANAKFENTFEVVGHTKCNLEEHYNSTNYTEIPLRLKKEFQSPLSSPVSSRVIMNGKVYSHFQSPEQFELYSAISNNISDSVQYNTDTCSSSSPSTIKSITFKH